MSRRVLGEINTETANYSGVKVAGEPARSDRDRDSVQPNGNSWGRILGRLKGQVGENAYRSFFQSLRIESGAAPEIVLLAPTRFLRDWVATHYADHLLAAWRVENPAVERVDVVVDPRVDPRIDPQGGAGLVREARSVEPAANSAGSAVRNATAATPVTTGEGASIVEIAEERGYLAAALDPRFTFDNFVVGKPNELAHAAARRVAETCAGPTRAVPFNPLFLYGGVGLGKTHLMHAIAWHVRMNAPERKVIYLSAEKFMYQFIRALRFRSTIDFKEQFRSVDLLMIDDVQFISGKESTQEEFFHTFNALVDQNRQIVISADKSPSDLERMEERMRSRLGWGLVADIHPTTYELRLGILQSKADEAGLRLPQKVMEFLAHKIVSNVRELEGALNRITAQMQLIGGDITLESAQELLRDLLRANERRVTIDEIQRRVAEHFNIKMAEMTSARRSRIVARPRQVAMYLAKQLTSRSLPEIGRKFGGRDHTTVMHGVRKIEELTATDQGLAEDVELLRRMLEN
ncbi:MAG TPA: chromosomal replication initiator protein DnaA [Stellaceae bacterium]|jgi:chromosomal replication initiator protein|nr:chromosomal replication initiator protein DnaA [Stellaceae bacterium]